MLQGKLYVRGDSKIFRFQNGKSESLFLQRKNPRRIAWTVLYRRQHRKGISEVGHPPLWLLMRWFGGNTRSPFRVWMARSDDSTLEKTAQEMET